MKFSSALILIAYIIFDKSYSLQFDIWGDLRDTNLIVGNAQIKYAIPFIKRTVDISYPEFGDEKYGVIRGIKHSNRLNDENCQPEARLIRGGVNNSTATVKITSSRGCGIDSLVQFFIEKPK